MVSFQNCTSLTSFVGLLKNSLILFSLWLCGVFVATHGPFPVFLGELLPAASIVVQRLGRLQDVGFSWTWT